MMALFAASRNCRADSYTDGQGTDNEALGWIFHGAL